MILFLGLTVAVATYFDLKFRRIPNWLTYSSIAFSCFYFEQIFIIFILVGIIVGLIFGKLIGSGDIKLSVSVAIWSQILNLTQYWIYFALILAGFGALIGREKSLPFAPYIGAGLICANLARRMGFI